MERDIVERLREIAGPIVPNVCTDAAEAIERLRARVGQLEADASALAAERDEARRKLCIWYELHKRGDGTGTANEFGWDCFKQDKTMITQSQRDMRFFAYVREEVADEAKDKFFTVMFVADIMAAVDRVIAERDEARRMWCEQESRIWDEPATAPPEYFATEKGWDCFKEDGK